MGADSDGDDWDGENVTMDVNGQNNNAGQQNGSPYGEQPQEDNEAQDAGGATGQADDDMEHNDNTSDDVADNAENV